MRLVVVVVVVVVVIIIIINEKCERPVYNTESSHLVKEPFK